MPSGSIQAIPPNCPITGITTVNSGFNAIWFDSSYSASAHRLSQSTSGACFNAIWFDSSYSARHEPGRFAPDPRFNAIWFDSSYSAKEGLKALGGKFKEFQCHLVRFKLFRSI